jgi:RHS repeat-associated protein
MPAQGTNNNGNVAGMYYSDSANSGLSHTASYNYDGVNRLSGAAATGNSTYSQSYTYDPYGNMSCAASPAENKCIALTYSASTNQITTSGYAYDAAGDLQNDGTYTYQWDAEARLAKVINGAGTAISTNTYNALGQRVRDVTTSSTTDEAYGAGGNLLWRYTGDPSNMRSFVPFRGAILAEYYPGTGTMNPLEVGSMTTTTSGTLFDHPDELGSITTGTSYDGSPCQERLFYPFGELWTGAGSCGMHQTFAQLPDYDSETDQYNTANRHYNPTGRWLSPDPGGLKAVKLEDPQTWNMYAYVRNNPTTLTDPTGMYNTDCASKDIKKCRKEIQDLDANIRKDLQSRDPSVRAAAAVYGSFNDGNKVNIRFDSNARKPGEGKQDRDASGKRLDSITVTFQGMTKDSSGRALVAHEGSHVEDFQAFIAGGPKPSAYAGEMKAFETGAGVLLDEPKGANFRVGDSHMTIERPDSDDNRKNNAWVFRTFLDWSYQLTPENPGTFDWERP